MKTVGVTGGMGSGKSTVCRLFNLLGVPVFYADDEAKKLYDEARVRSQVVKLFGKQVLGKDKRIDKKKLAELAFSDKALLARLNALIHPLVRARFLAWKKKQKGAKMVIKEAAIMVESGSHKELDFLISINSPNELRINRILSRNSMSVEAIEKRLSEQISDQERAKYADAIIVNDEQHSLIEQVLALHKKLTVK